MTDIAFKKAIENLPP